VSCFPLSEVTSLFHGAIVLPHMAVWRWCTIFQKHRRILQVERDLIPPSKKGTTNNEARLLLIGLFLSRSLITTVSKASELTGQPYWNVSTASWLKLGASTALGTNWSSTHFFKRPQTKSCYIYSLPRGNALLLFGALGIATDGALGWHYEKPWV